VTAPAAALAAVFVTGVGHPDRRLGALCFLVGAGILVWAPLVATGRRALHATIAGSIGVSIMLLVPAVAIGATVTGALGAGIAMAGFFLLVGGIAAMAARLANAPAFGVALAGLLGALLAASFHVGDPLIEWEGPGKASSFALGLLHAMNPLSGAVGDAIDVDWLRMTIMYRGFPGSVDGGLSTAQYYYWTWFPWWGTALLHGVLGGALLAGASAAERLRWRRA
jgi:hypothetical protein